MSGAKEFVGFRATICGIEELPGHAEAGVTHMLALLDPGWPEPPAYGAFGAHRRLDLRFHDVVDESPDMRAVAATDVDALLRFGRDLEEQDGAHLLVHCQKGLSRSSAALMLILAQARPHRPAEETLAEVVRIRPRAWPNLRIVELGDAALARGGNLVAAVAARYCELITRRPEFVARMIEMGRNREVELARAAGGRF